MRPGYICDENVYTHILFFVCVVGQTMDMHAYRADTARYGTRGSPLWTGLAHALLFACTNQTENITTYIEDQRACNITRVYTTGRTLALASSFIADLSSSDSFV